MRITRDGLAVIDGDTGYSLIVEESGDIEYDCRTISAVTKLMRPGDTVVDCGAFIGAHTHAYLKAAGSSGTVVAFEPNPEAFGCLVFNCPDATCHQVALDSTARDMWISISDNACQSHASFVQTARSAFVRTRTLDSFGLKPNVIKIDVEGQEIGVIYGAADTISSFRPILVVECSARNLARSQHSPDDLIDIVRSAGYRVTPLLDWQHMGDEKLDLLCTPL